MTAHWKTASSLTLILLFAFGSSVPAQTNGDDGGTTSSRVRDEVTLRPGDALQVGVWPDEELSGEFVVEETGRVYLPFLGPVQAAGISIDQLRTQLRDGYGEVMKNPVVTVTPLYRVGVHGAVRGPGVYSISPSHTLLDVIGMAGGFQERAKAEKVRIIRQRQQRVIELNAQRALETGLGLEALQLQSGDQVVVPLKKGGISAGDVLTVLRTAALVGLIIERFGPGNN